MPINRKMLKAMIQEYGEKKGKEVYYAMENKRKHKKKKGNLSKMLRGER